MTRQLPPLQLSFCLALLLGCCVLLPARADDLPVRKAGLWEMKILKTGAGLPDMTMQHCTDETTDKDMSNTVSPMAKQVCSKQDVQKTATGFVADSVCTVAGVSMTSHSEIVGDFNSGYTVKTTAHIQRGDKPVDTVTTIDSVAVVVRPWVSVTVKVKLSVTVEPAAMVSNAATLVGS